ncbi:hypothetical protein EVAR_83066_1 [Eumeta japonica]|uniref:Uncharacterized protein n=1 Tax=Eumeta variegata TaxID=151549 RepID=A0A4C1VP38_EUMVA|nr:hypothetical protein EVAR_83066_1 [Eumeta japonica]
MVMTEAKGHESLRPVGLRAPGPPLTEYQQSFIIKNHLTGGRPERLYYRGMSLHIFFNFHSRDLGLKLDQASLKPCPVRNGATKDRPCNTDATTTSGTDSLICSLKHGDCGIQFRLNLTLSDSKTFSNQRFRKLVAFPRRYDSTHERTADPSLKDSCPVDVL